MSARNVVVTGIDAITPAGIGVAPLWSALLDGRTFGARIEKFDVSRNSAQIGAAIPGFDAVALGVAAERAARLDRSSQLAVIAARRAVDDAGVTGTVSTRRIGVCIGSAIGGIEFMEESFRRCCRPAKEKPSRVAVRRNLVGPEVYGAFLATSISTEVARDRGFTGPCTLMGTGCTAGLDAIGTAASMIEAGMAEVMITGGVDAPLTPIVFTSFDNIRALTRRNSDPARASRPFDRDRDGFLLAEGCAILVLEEELAARHRGARIYGRVLGHASLSNAYHMTGLPADGAILARAIERALDRAHVDRDEIDYINAHGSSTQQNDRNETAAFKRVFGERAWTIPISSTKSCIGHSLGAASAIETVVCLIALSRGIVPPTLNYQTPCDECDLDYVPNEARQRPLRVVANNCSGFSGIHSAAILAHADYEPRGAVHA